MPTHTYSGDPQANDIDAIRFRIGDTISAEWELSDEEIMAELEEVGGSRGRASVRLIRRLMAKYARIVNKAVGPFRLDASQKFEQYRKLLAELEGESNDDEGGDTEDHIRPALVPGVYAGGISSPPAFTRYDRSGWRP
jgi:hypothetical protein